MPIKAEKPEQTFTVAPAGTHVARVFKIMNLGSRIQTYQGVPKDYPDTLVNISWELPNELNKFTVKNEDGTEEEVEKPFAVSREFTLSMGPKSNLRPIVEGIIGVRLTDDEAYNFDLEDLLGKTCQLTVMHKPSKDGSRTYANVVSTAPLMKGVEVPEPFNDAVIQNVKEMPLEEINSLPDWLREKMEESYEYKNRFGDHLPENEKVPPPQSEDDGGVEYPEEDIKPEDIPFDGEQSNS